MAEPPLYSMAELQTVITVADVLDAHEMLDVRDAVRIAQQKR